MSIPDPRKCGRCGLRVSAGACDTPPLVFHDRPEQCIEALKTELARVRKEYNDEMREAQRDAARAFAEGRAEADRKGPDW
jgi:hypothetical protein